MSQKEKTRTSIQSQLSSLNHSKVTTKLSSTLATIKPPDTRLYKLSRN